MLLTSELVTDHGGAVVWIQALRWRTKVGQRATWDQWLTESPGYRGGESRAEAEDFGVMSRYGGDCGNIAEQRMPIDYFDKEVPESKAALPLLSNVRKVLVPVLPRWTRSPVDVLGQALGARPSLGDLYQSRASA